MNINLIVCSNPENLRDTTASMVNEENLTTGDLDDLSAIYLRELCHLLRKHEYIYDVDRDGDFRKWNGGAMSHHASKYGHHIVCYGVCVLLNGRDDGHAQSIAESAFNEADNEATELVRRCAAKTAEGNRRFAAEQEVDGAL